MNVGLDCIMSIVAFNAVMAWQLKYVNNFYIYWYSNIMRTFALSKVVPKRFFVAFSFFTLFSATYMATYMLLLLLRHLYCRPCLLYFRRLLVTCVWHDLSDNFFVRQKSYDFYRSFGISLRDGCTDSLSVLPSLRWSLTRYKHKPVAAEAVCEWGGKPRRSGGWKFPRVQGRSPGRSLGDKVPQKLRVFRKICIKFGQIWRRFLRILAVLFYLSCGLQLQKNVM